MAAQNHAEVETCMQLLAELFPTTGAESGDAEIALWREDFGKYPHDLCVRALKDHKRGPRGRFHGVGLEEIFDRVRTLAVERRAKDRDRRGTDDSFADVVRRHTPAWSGVGDFEVIVRYWRGQWTRYAAEDRHRRALLANARGLIPAMKRDGRELQLDEQLGVQRAADAYEALLDEQLAGRRQHCLLRCAYCLDAAGMEMQQAERTAAFIFEDPPMFRLALEELRARGAEEVVFT